MRIYVGEMKSEGGDEGRRGEGILRNRDNSNFYYI